MSDTVAELLDLATQIERLADIERNNVTPTLEDCDLLDIYPEDLPSFEPGYITGDEYHSYLWSVNLLRRRARQLQGETE